MARFRRLVVPGYPHHITQRGVRRQTTFFDELDYKRYLRIANSLLSTASLEIWAYCLMPNHIHAVVIPRDRGGLARYFGVLHKTYAELTNLRYEWAGHLWQNRFYSTVMDERHTLAALRYVELNPVRSGLVRAPQDWPWSSARGNLNLRDDPLLRGRRALELVGNWSEYISGPEKECDIQSIRKTTRTGRPTGDDVFIDRLESLSGRQIRRRRAGRKKE